MLGCDTGGRLAGLIHFSVSRRLFSKSSRRRAVGSTPEISALILTPSQRESPSPSATSWLMTRSAHDRSTTSALHGLRVE
jgi:hypothetical protein